MNENQVTNRSFVRIPARVIEGLNSNESLVGIAADKIEEIVWEAGIVLKSFRYHSYDPLNSFYIFCEGADRMADKVMNEAVQKLSKMDDVEVVHYTTATREVVGVENLINTIKDLHKQAKHDNDNNNTKL